MLELQNHNVRGTRMRPLKMALVVGITFAASSAAAQAPPTLSGEVLTGVPQVTSSCNVSANSTISYMVSGASTAPYPGTFTESGFATIGPQPSPGQAVPVTSFSASFVIESDGTTITGTKHLTQDVFIATGLGFCNDFL